MRLQPKEYVPLFVEGLLASHNYKAIAHVYFDYIQDYRSGIEALIRAHDWNEALVHMYKHNLLDMIPFLKQQLQDYAIGFGNEMKVISNTIQKQVERLRMVRIEKRAPGIFLFTVVVDEGLQDIEMLDDTASMATTRVTGTTNSKYSGMTGMTHRTGKTARQRRKMARKRASGKSAAFEDEFLMKTLSQTIHKINRIQETISSLIQQLISFGMLEQAHVVQMSFKNVCDVIQRNEQEIFCMQPIDVIQPYEDEQLKPSVVETVSLNQIKWWSDVLDL
jgi:elongator complex protein 1